MSDKTEQLLHTLEYGIQLKEIPRTGCLQRGVRNVENVAAHSYSVALCAMALLDVIEIDPPLNKARVLEITILHDLPESLTSDIPAPVKRFFPAEQYKTLKHHIERNAMQEIVADTPFANRWESLWEEYAASETPEAKLAKDVDKLDMYLQVYAYEQHTGNRRLAEFWETAHTFYYVEAQAIYDLLVDKRKNWLNE